ncbi:hypothetical protein FACS189485_04110 [Spirochaetia bacterium]|nr:hypothetical protein FACS189485_04110 [Spirochaetia bacterium]
MKNIIVFIVLLAFLGCTGQKEQAKVSGTSAKDVSAKAVDKVRFEPIDPARTDVDPNKIDYEVFNIGEAHIGNVKRYTYNVVVTQRLTKVDFEKIAQTVYEKAKKDTPFNALAVGFYDYPEFLREGYRLGWAEFAPNGKWADAMTVKTGNYSSIKMTSHLETPNWDNAITYQEAIILTEFYKLASELSKNAKTGEELNEAEQKATDAITKKYQISPEAFDEIFFRSIGIMPW